MRNFEGTDGFTKNREKCIDSWVGKVENTRESCGAEELPVENGKSGRGLGAGHWNYLSQNEALVVAELSVLFSQHRNRSSKTEYLCV